MRKILTSVISIALTFIFVGFAPINAEENNDINYIVQELQKYEVPEEQIKNLIFKLENGIPWDSMSEEYSDLKPTTSISLGGYNYELTRYPDGSIRTTEILMDSSNLDRSITGGSLTWGSGNYWNMTGAFVKENTVLINAGFKANYSGDPSTLARITRVYDYYVIIFGGTYSFESLSIDKPVATHGSPAIATLRFSGDLLGGWVGGSAYVRLHVTGRAQAHSSYSF